MELDLPLVVNVSLKSRRYGFWNSLLLYIGKIFVYKHCFCYLNVQIVKQKKLFFVSPTNSYLVCILITIGDVTEIFAIDIIL